MINLISNLTAELSFKIYRAEPSTTIWTAGAGIRHIHEVCIPQKITRAWEHRG